MFISWLSEMLLFVNLNNLSLGYCNSCVSHFTQKYSFCGFSSVTQWCAILCDPMDPAHRLPCPSPTSRPCSNSCPLILWCHPTISSSVIPFFSFPASGSFPVSQFIISSIGTSALTSVLPMNIHDWFHLGLTGLISLQSKGLSRVFSNTAVQRHQFFGAQLSSQSQLSHPYMTTGKTIALTRRTFVGKVMSLLFNMLSRLVITFLPRSRHLLISWLQSPSALILEPPKIKSATVSTVSPSICHEVMEPDAMIFVFWMLSFKPIFFTLLFHFHQEAL